MQNVILTDFNSIEWKDVSDENLEKEITYLKKICEGMGLFGELGTNDQTDVHNQNTICSISNIILKDRVVYGDVDFFTNDIGKMAKSKIDTNKAKLKMRYGFHQDRIRIYTWDIQPLNN